MSIFREELVLQGSAELPITLDVTFNPDLRQMPVAVFCHGFKGFKDWGPWHLVADKFAAHGIFFVKINFSHNGVNYNDLTDISDAEAFGNNTLTTQFNDLDLVMQWLTGDNEIYRPYINPENITLIGHSLGAAIGLIKTIEDDRILRVVSWAGAFNLKKFAEMEEEGVWKERGYTQVTNGRTGDVYHLSYGFKEDFVQNATRFDLTKHLASLDQSFLIIHGTNDDVSPISNARKVHQFVSHALLIENEGNHVFGGRHPWLEDKLPPILYEVVQNTIDFITL